MRKTCTLLVLVAMLLGICPAAPVVATNEPYPVTLEEARQYVNQEIENVFGWQEYYRTREIINGSRLSLNEPAWYTHKALAYGTYFGATAANGERRYIGYNPRGNEFPNPNYPPDDEASTSLNTWEWVEFPWLHEWAKGGDLYIGLPNEQELSQSLNQKIIDGIEYSYGSHFNENAGSIFNGTGKDEWWRYVLIIQPPTKYTYGYGRMWHRWDSNKDGKKELWYITMRLAPDVLPPDIEISALTNDSPVYTGTEQTATATYKNNSKSAQTFEALFYMAENLINSETLTLAPGQEVTREYDWLAPEQAGQVMLKAEAKPVEGELNTANNQKSCTVEVEEEQPVEPPSLGCQEASSQTYTWDTQYHWTTTSTYTDSEGKTRTRTRHHYQTVTYSETLSATLTVNTKQGIPTDPNNPKPSDRESRGSWEIIPWAKKNGLNPNEVTRAGYGFEVKVETSYSTDWETKVPEKASKKGGTYYGPDKVTADFYDTKGRFVKRVNLVPTKGKAGDKNITWELPSEKHTFQDGSTVYERKHYTDINIPDGKYWVKVTVSGAGKSGLCLIQKKAVTIYKDMWEDSYTRLSAGD